jgi:hypothetical protein
MTVVYRLKQSDFRVGDSWKERIKNYPNTPAARLCTKFLGELMSGIRRRACIISQNGEEEEDSSPGGKPS